MKKQEIINDITYGLFIDVTNKLSSQYSNYITEPLDDGGKLSIHYAAHHGKLRLVEWLLMQRPALLNATDNFNQSAAIYAATENNLYIIKCLANSGADLNIATCNPEALQHGWSPIWWAANNKHNSMVKYLIQHGARITIDVENQHKNLVELALHTGNYDLFTTIAENLDIVGFIETKEQVIQCLFLDPTFAPKLLKNARTAALMYSSPEYLCITENDITWYKIKGRRPSFFACMEKETSKMTLFSPSNSVTSGTFGKVRLFAESKSSTFGLVVKSPRSYLIQQGKLTKERLSEDILKEVKFYHLVHPEHVSILFEFDSQKEYTYRHIMQHLGSPIDNFIVNLKFFNQFMTVVLCVTKALHHIHSNLGFIHGDIKSNNILIQCIDDHYVANFIDFGLSYYLTEQATIFKQSLNLIDFNYIAPERFCLNTEKLTPHASQDIYSYGKLFLNILEKHSSLNQIITEQCPFVPTFLQQSIHPDPEKRPLLEDLLTQLKQYFINLDVENEHATEKVSAGARP